MACKYLDENIAVFHGVFRGLRVRDLRAGTQIKPSLPVASQTLKTWSALPRIGFSAKKARLLAEWALFRDCGYVTIDPTYEPRSMLMYLSPETLAEEYAREGEMAYIKQMD